jgi:probable F420-dependent oxidoreductase
LPPEIGLAFPNSSVGSEQIVDSICRHAEDLGYASIWATDHVVGLDAMRPAYGEFWLEQLTLLTWIAARSSSLRIGTGVLVVPHRHPVLAAKMMATLDLLCGGRLDIGVGTGWSRDEFRALGAEPLFERRGAVTDEAIGIMRRGWQGGKLEHHGEHFDFGPIDCEPTPAQRPHPPLWIGGHSNAALRRTAAYGDRWHPANISPEDVQRLGAKLDASAGRPIPRTIRLHVRPSRIDALGELVEAYAAAGCVAVVLELLRPNIGDFVGLMEAAARRTISR